MNADKPIIRRIFYYFSHLFSNEFGGLISKVEWSCVARGPRFAHKCSRVIRTFNSY